MPVQNAVSEKSPVVDSKPADLLGKLSPDALPTLPPGGTKSTIAPIGGSNVPRQSLFHKVRWFVLLVFVLLIAAAVFLILNFNAKRSPGLVGNAPTVVPKALAVFVAPINVADVEFSSDLARDRFLKNFQDAGTATDINARYKLLLENFSQLEAIYSANHDPKIRKLLVDYSTYLVNNFPENSKNDNLVLNVPCYDSSCGMTSYPSAIKTIVSDVKASTLDSGVKQAVLAKLDEAGYSKEPSAQWTAYLNAFNLVKSQYDLKKDADVKKILLSLSDSMKSSYPDKYASVERLFPDLFKLE